MIGVLVLASGSNDWLYQLLPSLSHKKIRVFVHVDNKMKLAKTLVELFPDVIFLKDRVDVFWGGFSMVDATKRLIDKSYEYEGCIQSFCLISDSCYPIKSIDEFVEYCEDNNKLIHMNISDAVISELHPFYDRVAYSWPMDSDSTNPKTIKDKYLADYLKYYKEKKNLDMEIKVGANWMMLPRCIVDSIKSKDLSVYDAQFKYSRNADEFYFQTIIHSMIQSGELDQSNIVKNLHYSDFSKDGIIPGRPKVLDDSDLKDLLDSGKYFARKMDLRVSMKLKLMLDEKL